ncbi:benzoate/H(+) symporter BenE family transporter [Alteromonas ponticola]|uniref:Benzoate/H(+) symporter BenE family transporter n=1 Tax=Alteromonas ponticola TaxID=2720613 RepID=A0ABX1QYI8_9ALTE|nr:benzoate/H(+) symporter BenE family transporter [Alteromonas ponticola]NMH59297.1 benzoate/H(+) symporter BenE family transporter [Alteromonas ponticola]
MPLRISHISAGLTAVVVGYSSAVVIVIEAATAAGASASQVISWLCILGLGMGVSCIGLSLYHRMPVVSAWSTPGAAFLILAVPGYSLPEVTGAFISSALISIAVTQIKPLLKMIERIPPALSSGMLAGILLPFCLTVFVQGNEDPALMAAFIGVYLLGSFYFPRYVMLVLLVAAGCAGFVLNQAPLTFAPFQSPTLIWVTPEFSWAATLSLALPLSLITMLSQNLPGLAILHSHGYRPPSAGLLNSVNATTLISAPFGGFTFNLAAITAAICMGDHVDNDKQQRFWAGVMAGVFYLLAGTFAASIVSLFTQLPQLIIHLLAGLALIGTLQASLVKMINDEHHRHAGTLTFLCSGSGLTMIGLGSPVWGLMLGGLIVAFTHVRSEIKPTQKGAHSN